MDKQQNVDKDNKMTKEIKKQKWLLLALEKDNSVKIERTWSRVIRTLRHIGPLRGSATTNMYAFEKKWIGKYRKDLQ